MGIATGIASRHDFDAFWQLPLDAGAARSSNYFGLVDLANVRQAAESDSLANYRVCSFADVPFHGADGLIRTVWPRPVSLVSPHQSFPGRNGSLAMRAEAASLFPLCHSPSGLGY